MTYIDSSIAKLKSRYKTVYAKFEAGTAGPAELRWLIDNIDLIKPTNQPKYVVVAETRLLNVTKDGIHTFKEK